MKNLFYKINMAIVLVLLTSSLRAQASQQAPVIAQPPLGNGSHLKDTNYTIPTALKTDSNEAVHSNATDVDAAPLSSKRKPKFNFTAPSSGSTSGTNGSNVAPGK